MQGLNDACLENKMHCGDLSACTTLRQVHLKIQEISKGHKSFHHFHINQLLGNDVNKSDLNDFMGHIEALAAMGYIEFADKSKQEIKLTESGKLANIP